MKSSSSASSSTSMDNRVPLVELRGIHKSFGHVQASRDISIEVMKGSIHAIIGENGAGKSTAMNILYGMFKPDSGEIFVGGESRKWRSPRDAVAQGIGMVHQHFMLAGRCSGLDNILLGAEPEARGWRFLPRWLRPISRQKARQRLESLAAENQLKVDLDRPVDELPVGMQQRLEILKLLFRDSRVLILDEPTAVLTPLEVTQLFVTLRRLRDEGRSIILITHKLKEVLSIADRITVMRRGQVVGHASPKDATESSLAEMMVGRSVKIKGDGPPPPVTKGEALKLSHVTLSSGQEKPLLSDLNVTVARGEIVGIAGVEGNGQSELLKLLTDPRRFFGSSFFGYHGKLRAEGELSILGRDARGLDTAKVRSLGVGIVPEDRHHQGMVLGFDLGANFLLGRQRRSPYGKNGFIKSQVLGERLLKAMEEYDVRPLDPSLMAQGLSGGNQQKLVMARELEGDPAFLICAQPTRGVDVGAIEFIHGRILAARAAGAGVLLVSSELSEIQALADRILVLFEGRIVAEYSRGEADETRLGLHMGGSGSAGGVTHGA